MQRSSGRRRAAFPSATTAATSPLLPCPPCNSPAPWETARIHPLGRLDAGLVEDLEMVPIGGAEELCASRRNEMRTVAEHVAQEGI